MNNIMHSQEIATIDPQVHSRDAETCTMNPFTKQLHVLLIKMVSKAYWSISPSTCTVFVVNL